MKKIYLLFLLVCFSIYGLSQTWNLQNSGTIRNLSDVGFTDQLRGYAVGDEGTILYTSNGGQTWTFQNSTAVDVSCYGLSVTMAGTGNGKAVLCGENGKIFYAAFGTSNWQQASTNVVARLNDIILHEWSASSTTGYAVGENGIVLKTTDDGVTWTKLTTFAYPTAYLTGVSAASDNDVVVAGDLGFSAVSDDGGLTWTLVQSVPYVYMKAIACFSSGRPGVTTYLGGSDGALGTVVDNIFTPVNLGTNLGVMGLTFTGPSFGLGVGDLGFVTHYNGTDWVTQDTPTNEYLQNADGFAVPVDNTDDYTVYAWAVGLNGTIISTVQNVISGIKDTNPFGKVTLSPNPATGQVHITGINNEQTFTFRVFDISGKLILGVKGNGLSMIDLTGIAPGIYVATITMGIYIAHQKLIIQ